MLNSKNKLAEKQADINTTLMQNGLPEKNRKVRKYTMLDRVISTRIKSA